MPEIANGLEKIMTTQLSEYQFAVGAVRKWSQYNQEYYWTIEFLDKDSGKLHKTYVSEENYNFKKWQQLIDTIKDNDHCAICVSGVFRVKQDDIINADIRKLAYEFKCDRDELVHTVWDTYYA